MLSSYTTFVHLTFEAINSEHFGHLCLCCGHSGPPTLLNKPYNAFLYTVVFQTVKYMYWLLYNGMAPIKFVTSAARSICQYKNIRTKFLKCWVDIYFNRHYLAKKITPNYAKIKVQITSPVTNVTQSKIHTFRLKDEIRFLYTFVLHEWTLTHGTRPNLHNIGKYP